MSSQLFSPSWHRVESLVPCLRKHTRINRHHYRGELWYVLQDELSSRVHRFTPAAYYVIGLMDGERTVQEIWDYANERLIDDAPTQDEMIHLLSQLHAADVLQCDVTPDTSELLSRYKKQKKSKFVGRFLNPLSIRIPLFDPERFLTKFVPFIRIFPAWFSILVWMTVVISGLALAAMHWPSLTENVTDQVLTPQNLLIIWLIFPVIKAFHELGHALAIKVWGGEVHEIGIMLLVLMPIPYVDASSASSFRDKKKRVIVGAAGMIVEVFIAALAMFVWVNVEDGLVHVVAYNTMLIAGVSTILFNANPLLRFDGYYILADLIEIPNLGNRSNKYLGYLCQRYLFSVKNITKIQYMRGERSWFVFYGITSFLYRMFIATIIVMFISAKFFIIGVLLGIWSITMMLFVPAIKSFAKIFTQPQIKKKRKQALTVLSGIVAVVVSILMLVPVQSWTRTEGVIWVDGDSIVRAESDCFIEKLTDAVGGKVIIDEPLVQCRNVELMAKANILMSGLEELEAVYVMQVQTDRVKAEITREEINNLQATIESTKKELDGLIVKSKKSGVFIVPNATDLNEKYVRKGEPIGYILDKSTMTVKVVVDQDDINKVRLGTRTVEIRRADDIQPVIQAKINRQVPAATTQLPSAALTTQGGGSLALDPSAQDNLTAFKKVFLLDLELPVEVDNYYMGGRVYVKFVHDKEPIGTQIGRSLKQVLLGHFDV